MSKKLTEMSLEELWQLFPIILTEHQECWKKWYLEEETLLKKVLPKVQRISNIGSTAIPSIWAKPIVDILVEVPKKSNNRLCPNGRNRGTSYITYPLDFWKNFL